jgi:hypothetical protein
MRCHSLSGLPSPPSQATAVGILSNSSLALLPAHRRNAPVSPSISLHALGITLDHQPLALLSTRNLPRRAVRQGASWTAGLLPAADGPGGARPVRRSGCPRRPCWCTVLVVARPDDICPEEPPAGLERSGVVAVGDTASRQATGVGRRCPACGVHPSGLGVRDPAVRPSGVRSPGVVVQRVRRSAVCCPPIQRPAVCCPPVRCPAVWCLPRPSGHVRLLPPQAVGIRSRWPGDRDHRNRWRPLWLPGRRRLDRRSRRPGREQCCRRRVG